MPKLDVHSGGNGGDGLVGSVIFGYSTSDFNHDLKETVEILIDKLRSIHSDLKQRKRLNLYTCLLSGLCCLETYSGDLC
jgi:hypothetical protein